MWLLVHRENLETRSSVQDIEKRELCQESFNNIPKNTFELERLFPDEIGRG